MLHIYNYLNTNLMNVEKVTLFDFTINSEVSILFQCKFLFQTLDFNNT